AQGKRRRRKWRASKRSRGPACRRKPPDATMSTPVTQAKSAEARNAATGAMSSGCPDRPSGASAVTGSGTEYVQQSMQAYEQKVRGQMERALQRKAAALGYQLIRTRALPAEPVQALS